MTFKPMILEKEWRDFCTDVFTGDESEIQRSEMRRAFYAGIASMTAIYFELGAANVAEDEAIATMESISAELEAFGKAIADGKA